MKKIKIPLVRVVFVFVGLLAVNVVFLLTYGQTKSTKIKIANERVEMALQETERLKAWAEMAAVEARKAEAEAIMFQVEAEKQKELDVAEADRLKEALENCQN